MQLSICINDSLAVNNDDMISSTNLMTSNHSYDMFKMSVNGASTILGPVSKVMENWFACCYVQPI